MRILLDTHVALWAITDDPRLPAAARDLILAPKNEIFVSAASVWEIAIKHTLRRETMPVSGKEAVAFFSEAGYIALPVTAEHAAFVESLPSHHADPFDRILVSQALLEPMRLITRDAAISLYSDTVIKV